jgi:hypothetical protein
MKNQEIVSEILAYYNRCGSGQCSLWYVGIASNPINRLFVEHNVNKDNGNWIYGEAISAENARATEIYLIKQYGFDGDTGGGDEATRFVYAYRKTSTTRQ